MSCLKIAIVTCTALLLTQSNKGLGQPANPRQAANTTIDETMMRLLDDDKVRAELRLDEGQDLVLNLRLGNYANARKDLVKNAGKLKPEEKQRLDQEAVKLRTSLLQDVATILRSEQVARLAQVKLQASGAKSAFTVPSLRAALQVTTEQNKKFIDALIRYEDALYAEFRKLPADSDGKAAQDRMMAVHRIEKGKLERTILGEILDAVQRKRLNEAFGAALVLDIELIRAGSLFRELKSRAERLVPRYRAPYPLSVIVRLPAIRSALGTTPFENDQLTACADEWDKSQDRIHASLQYLNPRLQGIKFVEWETSYKAALPAFEAKLLAVLGATRFDRLKQLRRQICGPSVLISQEPIPDNELTSQQKGQISKAREQLGAELQKRIATIVVARTYHQLSPLYAALAKSREMAVVNVLTPSQKEAWRRLMGDPLDDQVPNTLRKEASHLLQQLPIRKG